MIGGSSVTFGVVVDSSANRTVNTVVDVPYNDGVDENFDVSVTATVGSGTPVDTNPPTARVVYAKALRVSTKYYYFAVQYTDDVAVDASTLDANDILVSRRKYPTLKAVLISDAPAADASSITAVYAVRYGPHGTWTSAFDGDWTLSVAKDQVADTSGNTVAAESLGVVGFLIPPVPVAAAVEPAAAATPAITSATPFATNKIWDN